VADVVYGSRIYGKPHRSLYFGHYMANRIISLIFNVLCNQTLTDTETCYKMFTREVLNSLNITSNDFGIEVQISCQIAPARKWRIYETAIHYYGRTFHEGKKVNWKDDLKALWCLVLYRVKLETDRGCAVVQTANPAASPTGCRDPARRGPQRPSSPFLMH
jgi:hypothetical protein